jgi:hypothetical protein
MENDLLQLKLTVGLLFYNYVTTFTYVAKIQSAKNL